MHEILPGIFEDNWEAIEKKIELVKGFAKSIHIDFADETFADKKSFFDPTPFKKYSSDIHFELHMMVDNPEQYLQSWSDAGFNRFIGHIEHMEDQVSFVAKAQNLGQVGLGLDAKTPLTDLKVSTQDLDTVLVMMTNAGKSGQEFQQEQLAKIKELSDRGVHVTIDGGINEQTIQTCVGSGGSRFISTSFLFWNDVSPVEQHKKLEEIISEQVV